MLPSHSCLKVHPRGASLTGILSSSCSDLCLVLQTSQWKQLLFLLFLYKYQTFFFSSRRYSLGVLLLSIQWDILHNVMSSVDKNKALRWRDWEQQGFLRLESVNHSAPTHLQLLHFFGPGTTVDSREGRRLLL